jgi:hypothetical protein
LGLEGGGADHGGLFLGTGSGVREKGSHPLPSP